MTNFFGRSLATSQKYEMVLTNKVVLVDWMVYIPQIIDSVPPPSTVLQLEGAGSVVIVQPHPPRRDDPEQPRIIDRIEQIIKLHNPKSEAG